MGGGFPETPISGGTNLLISGPPMTGKYRLLLDLLGGSSDNVVVISTQQPAGSIREDLAERHDTSEQNVAIVDAISRLRGFDTNGNDQTRFVSSPANLTQIGVGFTDFFARWEHSPTRVGIHSISQLAMYSEVKTVYKFLQVLTGQIKNGGWISFAVLDPSMHEDQARYILQDPFDGIIETRDAGDGGQQMRLRGLGVAPTEWISF